MSQNTDYRYINLAGNGPPNNGLPPAYYPYGQYAMPFQAPGEPLNPTPVPPYAAAPAYAAGFPPYMAPAMPTGSPVSPAPPQFQNTAPGSTIPGTKGTNLSLPGGAGMIFSKNLVTIHVISANIQPWNNPGATFSFQQYKVPAEFSMKDLIDQVVSKKGPQNQRVVARGVVEIHEHGNGEWRKGQEFWLADKGAHGDNDGMKKKIGRPISEYGWNSKRGTQGLPVWITCLQHYG
ncbi:hypothetical protein KEM55_002811 [Ascosphaera atra]|nr:hypothetical protein KEM55_002811 [Ascosphaera atra]